MKAFVGKRVAREFTQTNSAAPERVFPLLCPVREAEWVPGWQYRLIFSRSGFAEPECVFTTPNPDGSETTWQVTHYDRDTFSIKYAWVHPGTMAAQIDIRLQPSPGGKTTSKIRYTYTGLSEAGNEEVDRYTEDWFRDKMLSWQSAINQYLETGHLATATWE